MPKNPNDAPMTSSHRPLTAAPEGPRLSPKTVHEAIVCLLKAYGQYPDEIRIAAYAEALEGCTAEEVWEVVKHWMRLPHEREARPGELRDMVLTARRQRPVGDLDGPRVTPEEKQAIIRGLTPKARAFLRSACPQLFCEEP